MSGNEGRALSEALDERVIQGLKRLSVIEKPTLKKSLDSVNSSHSSLPPFIVETSRDVKSSKLKLSVDGDARCLTSPCSRDTEEEDTLSCLKEECLNIKSYKASSSLNDVSSSLLYGENTPSVRRGGPCEGGRSVSATNWRATRKIVSDEFIDGLLLPDSKLLKKAITEIGGSDSKKSSTFPKGQELINEALNSPDPDLHILADELTQLRSAHSSKSELLERERRQFQKELTLFKTEKLQFHETSRRLQLQQEVESCTSLEERQKLDQMRKELDAKKSRNSQMARTLEQWDLSMMEQASRLQTNGNFGEDPIGDLWRARLSEKHENALKEKTKYVSLNNELVEHKLKLDQLQRRLENEKRDLDRQKQLFRKAQKRLAEDRQKLSIKRKHVEVCASKLRRIKLCVNNETTQLVAQRNTFEAEFKNMQNEKEKLKSNKDSFCKEQDRLRKLEANTQNDLNQLMEKRRMLSKEEANINSLRPEIIREKALCNLRVKVNMDKRNELQDFEQSIATLIQAKQSERKAAKIMKKFEKELCSGQYFQQQVVGGSQKQRR